MNGGWNGVGGGGRDEGRDGGKMEVERALELEEPKHRERPIKARVSGECNSRQLKRHRGQ